MSKIGYFAEFIVFPLFLVALGYYVFTSDEAPSVSGWGTAFALGALFWTLAEYLLHRYCFHHAPYISDMHERHHDEPLEMIGSPAWLSLISGVTFVLAPLWAVMGLGLASGVTTGIAAGYLSYVAVHYGTHHWDAKRGSYMYRARLRHARHHYAPDDCNFGVTTAFWDYVFGTFEEGRRASEQQSWSEWLWGYWPWRGA